MTDPVDRGRNRSETFAEFARAEGFSLRVCPDTLGRITKFSKHEPN